MKLIIGLGNPGKEYEKTRHNVGFMILDKFAEDFGLSYAMKMNGMYAKGMMNNESFIILKPLSFMNLSGTVVKKYVDYYKIKQEDILVIQDDLDLPIGKIKIKSRGSCGGHNGIRNITDNLKTEDFARFKIGISKIDKDMVIDYVLGNFSKEEMELISKIREFSSIVIEDFIQKDISKVMNKYNGVEYEIK